MDDGESGSRRRRTGPLPGMERLRVAVEEAVAEIASLRGQLADAEARMSESDHLLREFVGGKQDPAALARRLSELEAENRELKERMNEGRESVEQVLARIQFLEDRA